MGVYATEHAGALADVSAAGSAVTFSLTSPGTYNESTDTYSTPVTTTVSGYAIQVDGDPDTYRALSLVEASAPSLFFIPTTYGALPGLGYACTWAGTPCTVRSVNALAPDGTAIGATIVVSA